MTEWPDFRPSEPLTPEEQEREHLGDLYLLLAAIGQRVLDAHPELREQYAPRARALARSLSEDL